MRNHFMSHLSLFGNAKVGLFARITKYYYQKVTDVSLFIWDLIPRNVLRDCDGDIFAVDAEKKMNVFMQPRAETKLAWAMLRQGKGRMKSNE